MEDRSGFKIVYVSECALMLFCLSGVTALLFSLDWPDSLWALTMVVVIAAVGVFLLRYTSRPKFVEGIYQNPGFGVVIGFSFCTVAITGYILGPEYAILGNGISMVLYFIGCPLLIVAGEVMTRETETGFKNETISDTT
jgi:hypothetical protein